MQIESLKVLACPKCLGNLALENEVLDKEEIKKGKLHCLECDLNFPIVDGVAIFGIRKKNLSERLVESNSEGLWASKIVSMDEHVSYARQSSWKGELAIKKLDKMMKANWREPGPNKNRIRVLDIGAGMGFQSWQFAKHGFKSFAVELCSEFLLAGGSLITAKNYFERVVADCTVLPFKKGSFDIIFCKEIIHHIGESLDLLSEISRVASPGALLYVSEPCASILLNEKTLRKTDRATHVGMSHKFYSLNDYIRILRKISPKIHIKGEVMALSKSNHPLLANVLLIISASHKKLVGLFPPLSTLLVRTELLLIGGSVEILGRKTMEYEREIDRDLVAIDKTRINDSLIQFYKETFIPAV